MLKKQLTILFTVGLLLASCATRNPKFFANVQKTEDLSYGYTAENPVTIKNVNLGNSINSSYYYISRLRSEKGNKLKLIERFSVKNPNYEKPKINITNRYTGEPLSYGTGPWLDMYILKPANENDTIIIYINPYLKGDIKIPYGLGFEKE
jgi:hypothetical protein